ncbi:MAG: GH116 family glycosyl hydrolase, partial [Chloroflexi bacterium]|nr:GH116 family glycosyl hydrolase [Chloroflexota bacterium]
EIGTGCIDIEADGRIGLCTVFKRVWGWDERDQVYAPPGKVIDVGPAGRGLYNLPFLGLSIGATTWVLATTPIQGVETAGRIHYWGHYPIADLEYETSAPVSVGLRAWAPFIPGDVAGSSIPGAVFEVHLRNNSACEQAGTLAFSFPGTAPSQLKQTQFGLQQHQNEALASTRLSGIQVAACDGSTAYALALVDEAPVRFGSALNDDGAAWAAISRRLPDLRQDAACDDGLSAALDFVLAPGQERVVRFVLAWRALEWESDFPYGEVHHRYRNRYADVFPTAWSAAQQLVSQHAQLLGRIVAWQQVIYAESGLPIWLRDQLINVLHLIAEDSLWAAAGSPLGDVAFRRNASYQEGCFALIEGADAAGQPTCIPCDWYGNFPIVFFFPDLAWSNLRALRINMRADGAVPFYLGQGLDLNGCGDAQSGPFAYDRQRTLNGPCYADLVDRLWHCTGDAGVLREFYPSVKQNTLFTLSRHPAPEGVIGIIAEVSDEWYEGMDMRGLTAHAGGARLAQLKIVARMAEALDDAAFARQCHEWVARAAQLLEDRLWEGGSYLLSASPTTGARNDLVLAFQLDGDWMAHLHGLPGVFRPDRARDTLDTIRRLNAATARGGVLNVVKRDGRTTTFGGRMGERCSMPASVFILAMNYMYAGQREVGLETAWRSLDYLVNDLGYTWDMPNMVRCVLRTGPGEHTLPRVAVTGPDLRQQPAGGYPWDEGRGTDDGGRIYGHDYYQCMSLWALPAALNGQSLAQFVAPGGLVNRVLTAKI